MRPATRTTLLLAATLAIPFALFLWWTEADLRPRLENEARTSLEQQARIIRATIGTAPYSDSLADVLGQASGSRITLIDPTGRVVGDSDVDPGRLSQVDNHAGRPEVAAALRGEPGFAIRASETVALRLLYVAVPDARGVVRVSVPLSRVDGLVVRSRQWVMAGGLMTLVLVGLLGRHLARFWTRPVTRLQEALGAVGRGEVGPRVGLEGHGAMASLGRSVDEAAARIEESISELSRERSGLRAMFDELEDGVAQVDSEGVILRHNRAFERWIGRPGLVGERIGGLLRHPGNLAAVRSAIAGEAGSNESQIGASTVLLTANPDDRGALIVLRDLTHTRQLEAVRRDFVANASHELKTPLTSIRGFAEAIADDGDVADQARGFAERIIANTERMQALVDDLLDLGRIESGGWSPTPVAVDLEAITRDAWEALDPLPREAGVKLDFRAPGGHDLELDFEATQQIMRNLLDNAIRYAPADSAIVVSVKRDGPADEVVVEDSGAGIPGDQVERVFERFYRVDAARSREAGGTGLGLSIVKHLVAAQGGTVRIESELGRGTRVCLTFPAPSSEGGAPRS
jgi:two-component system phosphate regulon sensor histidine kinase PhoR